MKGAFPPSSKLTRLTVDVHWAASNLPTAVDPVKESLRMSGDSASSLPTTGALSRLQVTTFTAPRGTPACSAIAAMARADNGVSSAGLITDAHPAARAGATLRAIMAFGKFHGVMSAQGPTACLMVSKRLLGCWCGMTVPYARLPSSANQAKKEAPYATSPLASANGLPHSRDSKRPRSSWCSSMASCIACSQWARCSAVVPRMKAVASCAASIAELTS
mmetsp:Transcript_16336/g.51914  ORF Transcript_16336/g.51914 Transcript_16336/m.51914 type:complete len:219 (+) Transcript_16336:774-1430(+)